jgi:hypothetical protein
MLDERLSAKQSISERYILATRTNVVQTLCKESGSRRKGVCFFGEASRLVLWRLRCTSDSFQLASVRFWLPARQNKRNPGFRKMVTE